LNTVAGRENAPSKDVAAIMAAQDMTKMKKGELRVGRDSCKKQPKVS